jgi:hypothetical protein
MGVGLAKTWMEKEEHSQLAPKPLILTTNVRNFVLIELLSLNQGGLKKKQEEPSHAQKHLILTINVKNFVLTEQLMPILVGLKNNQKEHSHAPEHLTLPINVTNFVLTELRRPILRGLKKNQVSPFSNTNTLLQVRFSLFFSFVFFFLGGGGFSGTCQPLGSSHLEMEESFLTPLKN